MLSASDSKSDLNFVQTLDLAFEYSADLEFVQEFELEVEELLNLGVYQVLDQLTGAHYRQRVRSI